MCSRLMVLFLALCLSLDDFVLARSRQKRCIVIQKQSGSHGDSMEDGADDEGYRQPQPKEPRPDRLRRPKETDDAENLSPELVRYRMLPIIPINREYRIRNRVFKKYLIR